MKISKIVFVLYTHGKLECLIKGQKYNLLSIQVLSPCLFKICTKVIIEHIKGKPGVKINGKIINNLRYTDDTVLMAE
jgi:hypothetical protein